MDNSLRGEYVVLISSATPVEEGFFESLEKLNLGTVAVRPKTLIISARKELSSVLPLDPALR